MSSALLFSFVIGYFLVLLVVAYYTSRNSNNDSFFIGNRNSNWMLVAFGMIGTSLSGVTFVSVPGTVGSSGFAYFQVVIGYLLGYIIIAFVLLPLYYKLSLTSIYHYLQHRFGPVSYKTGALFFIISRTLGATARLYLVINVLQIFILEAMGVPFWVTTFVILLMILLYTFEGGVKTIVFTDTLQTTFMLFGLVACIIFVLNNIPHSPGEIFAGMNERGLTRVFNTDPDSSSFFLKHILGGMFITVAMTGLDQEMMQKNISVSNLKDSQKNMITLSFLQLIVVFIFLALGGLLYLYALQQGAVYTQASGGGMQLMLDGKNVIGDNIFPEIAFNYLPPFIGIIFIIGLISALFPSADGALTALTSSFCIDIIGLKNKTGWSEQKKSKVRLFVHNTFALVFLACVFFFREVDNGSLIQTLLVVAGYTYGPLLALFTFGIFTRREVRDAAVPLICILAPVICYILKSHEQDWLGGYVIGTELLIINAGLAFLLLFLCSRRKEAAAAQ